MHRGLSQSGRSVLIEEPKKGEQTKEMDFRHDDSWDNCLHLFRRVLEDPKG